MKKIKYFSASFFVINTFTMLMILLILFVDHQSYAQGKFITKNGHVSFYSSAPLENIEAQNNEVLSIIDLSNKAIAVDMLMKSFAFEKSLMQEHFNENYIESDKFPKATFKGTIATDVAIDPTQEGVYEVEVSGDLTIHGVTKPITTKGTIEVKDNQVFVKSKFPVTVKDYNIAIPKIVVDNIAEVVEVTIDLKYSPFNS